MIFSVTQYCSKSNQSRERSLYWYLGSIDLKSFCFLVFEKITFSKWIYSHLYRFPIYIPQKSPLFLEVNNRNTRTWCEICSMFKPCQWHRSVAFILNFEHTSQLVLVLLLLTLNIQLPAGSYIKDRFLRCS